MKVRIGAAAALAFLTLAACSSSTNGTGNPFSPGGSPPPSGSSAPQTTDGTGQHAPGVLTNGPTGGTASSAFCTKLQSALTKLAGLGSDLSDPTKIKDSIGADAKTFEALEADAPPDIAPTVRDTATLLKSVAKYLDNPSSGSSGIEDLTTKLPTDIEKLGAYGAAHCN